MEGPECCAKKHWLDFEGRGKPLKAFEEGWDDRIELVL